MAEHPRFRLIVAKGIDRGASLMVDEQPRMVGRGRGTDLGLTDLGVSRQHLEVVARAGCVHVRLCSGAAPLIVRGEEHTEAALLPGEELIVGNSVLAVLEVGSLEGSGSELTDLETILEGLSDDARGLSAVYALTERLDDAQDVKSVEGLVTTWSRERLTADGARLVMLDTEASPRQDHQLVACAFENGCEIVVPISGTAPARLSFVFSRAPAQIGDSLRRILVVAGRVCGSTLSRLSALAAADAELESFRRIAVGSARAFLGTSPAAAQMTKLIPKLAASDAALLLLGETGSGKSFVARLIHESSQRAREPFRIVNCAAIPEGLLESELFGHEKGAFTGAIAARPGVFESAGRGTVLLDEIGDLTLASQAKLLTVLEERRFERVGSNRARPVEARILAATNRDLEAMVSAGTFRNDLYFRLCVVTVKVPPLRDRGDDLELLAKYLLTDLAETSGRRVTGFSAEALAAIRRYPWPGNVRELKNAIERALVLGDGRSVQPSDLPETVYRAASRGAAIDPWLLELPQSLEVVEARAVEAAMRATGGNRTRAATLLGISRVTLYKKLKEEPES